MRRLILRADLRLRRGTDDLDARESKVANDVWRRMERKGYVRTRRVGTIRPCLRGGAGIQQKGDDQERQRKQKIIALDKLPIAAVGPHLLRPQSKAHAAGFGTE